MVIELGAVRLLAPWFGTSSSVWTNVIGVVLAALALGYALGARLASGRSPLRRLGTVLLLGAAFAAWLPIAASGIAAWFMPAGVALHDAAELLVWGSLGAATVLFLPAAATLGCAGPLAVEVLQRVRGGGAGRAGGHVLAASTIGSLVGTFGTTHLFIPSLGVTGTFLTASVVLAAAGLWLWFASARGTRSTVQAVGLVLLSVGGGTLSASSAEARPPGEGETLLASADSSMQSLRVIESGEGAQRMRFLRVNESLDSFQSVWKPEPGLLLGGHYYDYFALPYAWTFHELGEAPPTWDVLVIGLGAGTAVRVLEGALADGTRLRTVGVEIDPEVVELGAEYFDLERGTDDRVAVGGMDGRAALRYMDRQFDQIIVDAYANNMEIPPHLASTEAFAAMGAILKPRGWISINVGGFGLEDPVVRAVAAAAAVGLQETVSIGRIPFSRNLGVWLRKDDEVPRPSTSEFGSLGQPLPGGTGQLIEGFSVPGAWARLEPEALAESAKNDDRSAMEELQLESILLASKHLHELDDASGDGSEERVAGPAATQDDEANFASVQALQGEGVDMALAFEAARAIESPRLRQTAESRLLWGAGDLFGALDAATQGLRFVPRDPGLLLTAVNLGLIVGASQASGERLARLQEVVDTDASMDTPTRDWYRGQIAPLIDLQADAQRLRQAKERAVKLSRWSTFAMAGAALGLILALAFTGRVGGASSASTTG
ncbi:spermidine synthase [Planctomycetes bacterium Poly30]|uniref:Spermidine synthase n=2 Tax=Saltatorellus ferox TaxID=2528018 RepID=A0A518ETE6_9BACT|nr:spermidine synthase [Planctomycetes bacterium Poly30]